MITTGKKPFGSNRQVALHQLAEFFAVLVFHVYEFYAAAVRTKISHYRGKVNPAQPRADFQLDRISHGEFLRRFQVGPAQADGSHARQPCLRAVNVRSQRRFQRYSHIPSRNNIIADGLRGRFKPRAWP